MEGPLALPGAEILKSYLISLKMSTYEGSPQSKQSCNKESELMKLVKFYGWFVFTCRMMILTFAFKKIHPLSINVTAINSHIKTTHLIYMIYIQQIATSDMQSWLPYQWFTPWSPTNYSFETYMGQEWSK